MALVALWRTMSIQSVKRENWHVVLSGSFTKFLITHLRVYPETEKEGVSFYSWNIFSYFARFESTLQSVVYSRKCPLHIPDELPLILFEKFVPSPDQVLKIFYTAAVSPISNPTCVKLILVLMYWASFLCCYVNILKRTEWCLNDRRERQRTREFGFNFY